MSLSLTHTTREPPKVTFSSNFINSLDNTCKTALLFEYTVTARDAAYIFLQTPEESHGLGSLDSMAFDALKYEVRLEEVPQIRPAASISKTNRTGKEYRGEIIVKLESPKKNLILELIWARSEDEFVRSATQNILKYNVLEDARNAFLETEKGLVKLYKLAEPLFEEREAKRRDEEAEIVELPLTDLLSKHRHDYSQVPLPMQQDVD